MPLEQLRQYLACTCHHDNHERPVVGVQVPCRRGSFRVVSELLQCCSSRGTSGCGSASTRATASTSTGSSTSASAVVSATTHAGDGACEGVTPCTRLQGCCRVDADKHMSAHWERSVGVRDLGEQREARRHTVHGHHTCPGASVRQAHCGPRGVRAREHVAGGIVAQDDIGGGANDFLFRQGCEARTPQGLTYEPALAVPHAALVHAWKWLHRPAPVR